MSTALETFEHIVRHQSMAELVPFLLHLAPGEVVPVRQKVLQLKAELTTSYEVALASGKTESVVPLTLPQSEMLYVAGLATYSRKEALGRGFESQWADKWPATAGVAQSAFLTVLAHARPSWLTDWLVGLTRQADWMQLSAPYWLLHELLDRGLIAYEPWLFAQAAAHLLTAYNEQDSKEEGTQDDCEQRFLESLRADFPRLGRDLLLFFDYETPVLSAYFYGGKNDESFTWGTLLPQLVASGHLDRGDLLTRCLLALRRDFPRPLLTWFKELYLSLKPTPAERLTRQAELTELLAHPLAQVVNFALDQLKYLLPEPGFVLAPFLVATEPLLTRADLKTSLRTLLAGFPKLLKQAPTHAPAVARLLASALAHPDAAVQERAAKGLAELLSAKKPLLPATELAELNTAIGSQADLLGAAARTILAPWLTIAPGATNTPTASYQTAAQFVPDLSPATAIAPVADWHELLFLTGQVLRHDDPAATERWLDGLLRLQGQLPADYAAQLQPYLVQVLPPLKKANAAEAATLLAAPLRLQGHEALVLTLLLSWVTGFATPRLGSVQVAARYAAPLALLTLTQQRYQLVETKLREGHLLPLLSTPTHQPHWVAPSILVDKLLAYQAAGLTPDSTNLLLALTRTAHAHPAEAAAAQRLLPQLADTRLRELLEWFLGAPGQPLPALPPAHGRAAAAMQAAPSEALPELWAVAARTKAPAETFPALTACLGYDCPGVTQPLRSMFEVVPRENVFPDLDKPGQEGTFRFIELAWSNGATAAAPSPLLAYAPPVGKSEYGSWEENSLLASDLPFLTALAPNYAAPIYDQALRCAAWTDNLETAERDVLTQALRTLLGPGPALPPAATAVLASGLVHHTALCRSLAQEGLLQAIAHGRLVPAALGEVLGQQLAVSYTPTPRLTDNLLPLKGIDALTDDALRQILDALLPELPAAPPRNLRPLLEFYADLLARTGQPVPAAARPNLLAWQPVASLKARAKALLALAD